MSEFLNNPCFQRDISNANPRPWKLHEALRYRSTLLGYTLVVPAGYRTDMGSIPWFFTRLFPKVGQHNLACVVHDYMITHMSNDYDSKFAAKVFREALIVLGVPAWRRNSMYYAVRYLGPKFP